MDSRFDTQRRAAGGGGGSASSSPALGAQSRRRKMPPRPADFKLQIIIIGSRGVGKTSLMERFTDDTFCEACKSTVGKKRRLLRDLTLFCQLIVGGSKGGFVYSLEERIFKVPRAGPYKHSLRLHRVMGLNIGYASGSS